MAGLMSDTLAEQRKKDAAAADAQKGPPKDNPPRKGSSGAMPAGKGMVPKSSYDAAKARQAQQAKNLNTLTGGLLGGSNGQTAEAGTPSVTRPRPTIPKNKGDNTRTLVSNRPKKSAPKSAAPKKSNGSAGAASNRDLPGRTTITYAPAKKDKAALAAQSKASLADSKRAAASRGDKSHFSKREK